MSNDLIIPDKSPIPSFLINKAAAQAIIDDAAAGIGAGAHPRIKCSGKAFLLVDANGEEKAFPPSQMFAGDSGFFMPVIILRAKRPFDKAWYIDPYVPGQEGKAPDCFSKDSIRPDASASAPQSETCASCAHNQFGTAKDNAGNAMKGKACPDVKKLAVFAAGSVYELKVPPGSLKKYREYLDQIRINLPDVPLYAIKTLIGFDATADSPVFVFAFGGFVGADNPSKQEAMVNALAGKAQSPEAEAIIGGNVAALLPPIKREALPEPSGPSLEELAAKEKAEAAEKAAKAAKAKAEKAAKEAKAKADAEAAAAAAAAASETSDDDSDDDLLRKELGL